MVLSKRILTVIFIVILAMAAFAFWNFYDLSADTNQLDQSVVDQIDEDDELLSILETTDSYEDLVEEEELFEEETTEEEEVIIEEEAESTTSEEETNLISEEDQKYFNQKLTELLDRNDEAKELLSEFHSDFLRQQGNLTEDQIDLIEADYQVSFSETDNEYQELKNSIESLQEQLSEQTVETRSDFVQSINSNSDLLIDFQEQTRATATNFYTTLISDMGQEQFELIVSNIKLDFLPSDNEEITFAFTFEHIGDKQMKNKFTYFSNFTINGELVDDCGKEVGKLSTLDSEQLTCEIRIKDYYNEFNQGKTDFLTFKLVGLIDSNIEINEVSESNNDFVWTMDMTLEEFN
ncbi:hypothetical protein HOA92_05810 [archaeon]|jgi:hypothetical protein|nr:hypothetical protein [archaeon]